MLSNFHEHIVHFIKKNIYSYHFPIFICFLVVDLQVFKFSLHIDPYQLFYLKIFSPIYGLSLLSLHFDAQKYLIFMMTHLFNFSSLYFWCDMSESITESKVTKTYPYESFFDIYRLISYI